VSTPAEGASASAPVRRAHLYARVWRWHFFAGLFVAPFAILLALTGSLYLFKPQIEHALERRVDAGLDRGPALPADALLSAALEARPGARFDRLFLPSAEDASAEIQLALADGNREIVWLERSSGRIVQAMAPDARAMRVVQKIHGELLGGRYGSTVVELAACWLIVLLVSGLYLAWPRNRGWLRALFPRLDFSNRRWLRDVHRAAGIWLATFVLLFLLSGLPWTGVWGGAFDRVRQLVRSDVPHDHGAEHHAGAPAPWLRSSTASAETLVRSSWRPRGDVVVSLQDIVERATRETLEPPVEIAPPAGEGGVWTVRSMTQRRPGRVTIEYDGVSGAERKRTTFADQAPLDRAVSYGISFHEGHLFGPLNQLFGLLVALGVIGMSASGLVMWWQRRPRGALAAPPLPSERRISRGIAVAILVLAVFLPLVGASLLAVLTAERVWTRLGSARAGRSTQPI
jgi:uncharacterized iron-regulated membrane protein